jgi:Ca2+-binding RTX toxin-like protein
MAVYSVSNDIQTARFDTGSLFGGIYDRDGSDDAAVLKFMVVDGQTRLVQSNAKYGVVAPDETSAHDYRIVFTGDITVRSRWDNDPTNNGVLTDLGNSFSTPAGESVTSDYKLDWAKSKISSIKYQVPASGATMSANDYTAWVTVIEVASTNSSLDLPYRANEFDSAWIQEFINGYAPTGRTNATEKDYNGAFEYQSVVYNWQYPVGTSSAQYFFGDDTVNGSRNDDVLRGYAGNDVVRGNYGDDLIYADYGNDQLFGGPGNDVLVFGGSSSSWDVDDFKYRTSSIELAVGGSGSDVFVFRPSEIIWSGKDSVYYNMSLPNLYNDSFKYKKVMAAELDPGFFKVNAMGQVLTVSSTGTETVVPGASAFTATNTPFQKYLMINVTSTQSTSTGTNPVTTHKLNYQPVGGSLIEIYSGTTNFTTSPGNFYVEASTGSVYKLPMGSTPSTANAITTNLIKASAFTAANNPAKNQALNGTMLDEKTAEIYYPVQNGQKVFIKFGADVVLTSRFNDDNTGIDLITSGYDDNGNFFVRSQSDDWHYNPFLSQSQNGTFFSGTATRDAAKDPANGISNLTQRIKIQDFKIGSDKIDLSAFGLSKDVLLANDAKLKGINGTTYLTALSTILTPEGLKISAAKNGWTSGNTSLFIKETADHNGNGTLDDTLLEIQLVGINISSINGRFFGESENPNLVSY